MRYLHRNKYCYVCDKKLSQRYLLNVFFRDPKKKYQTSGLTFIITENRQYCKKHFLEVSKKIKEIIN